MIRIDKVKLENARPYDLCQIEPHAHLNVIVGDNGCGKTTVLEAIYIALTGKSFKTSKLKEFIQNEKPYCKIQVTLNQEESREVVLKARSKELYKNGAKAKALSEFCQGIACISLIPEDVAMINGASQYRRRYLDHILFYQDPAYAGLLQDYKKALTQKNSLLKAKLDIKVYLDQVSPWHQQMIQYNQKIRQKRKSVIDQLFQPITNYYTEISAGKGQLTVSYKQNESDFAQSIAEKSVLEHALARSLYGSHKDDVQLDLRGYDLNHYASQGERASALLALKFAELNHIKQINQNIILLLDDIGGTLDAKRRHVLLEQLKTEKYQTFIASADKNIEEMSQKLGASIYKQKQIESGFTEHSLKSLLWKQQE
ncbi:MAG TPA: DNA replication and repair protein RecF [Oligoflexia bacterium]|nr:DNA replication and repair protein RecF [Oligoflexia bacterium]HMR25612.1 DNA replication and repair protein RecF [Oligoflexia bacterium]